MDYKEAAEYCVKNLMPNLSVFIGAGLSIDAKLPSWNVIALVFIVLRGNII